MSSPYQDACLARTAANYQPLTPLSFLARAAEVYRDDPAVLYGDARLTYAAFYARCRQLASALERLGVGVGDTVAAMLPNVPPMLECHYGAPMLGAVLNALNTRLDARSIAYMLDHGDAKVVVVDREFSGLMREALALAQAKPMVVEWADPAWDGQSALPEAQDYDSFVAGGDPAYAWRMPDDEWDAITLNYTSGTTGDPKGVVYSHRGAYLMCFTNVIAGRLGQQPVYLWTLPMFHCNGWCFPWVLSAVGGVHVCLRQVRAGPVYNLIARHRVTHLCGAPVVMATLLAATEAERQPLPSRVKFITAAAPPPEAVLAGMSEVGFDVVHVYGLTEVYGPSVVNEWRDDWDEKPADERARLKARQGVPYPGLEALAVLDPATLEPVPADGETLGEVMFRGNLVMKGYLKNERSTADAFAGGWFHSGDLGVMHPDGYVQLKDRSKDIIISGGENISSIEVEDALYKHPAVSAVAVVARPDEKWGEHPCAFVELKPGRTASADELIAFARGRLASFKAPRTIVFDDLPKTSTGKIQKYALRTRAKML